MVRPNGSVIADVVDSAMEFGSDPIIQRAFVTRYQAEQEAWYASHNLGTIGCGHNESVNLSAGDRQRLGGGGNGEFGSSAGSVAAGAGRGFLAFGAAFGAARAPFLVGSAGCSSA